MLKRNLVEMNSRTSQHGNASRPKGSRRCFIAEDGGFTSVGVVIALLLTLTLLFTTLQVYWLQSTAADIQFVADAGALAGENVVADYMIIVQSADAIVLSLSLFGLIVYGIATVVSCIPYCQEIGIKLMNFGSDVLKARDDFAKGAAEALSSLQKSLPFLVAVNAAATIQSNRISRYGEEHYLGLALPLPLEGASVNFADSDSVRQKADETAQQNSATAVLTDAAQQAFEEMQASKLEGYLADCGKNPNYCLYERVGRLAGLQSAQNPYFVSQETWLFDYAMARAQAYYRARLAAEKPESDKLQDQVRSFVRKRYFAFATQLIQTGYAHTTGDGTLNAYFPRMPRNANEVRQTILYSERVYPVSNDATLHGTSLCPVYQNDSGVIKGSVAELESGVYASCSACAFGIAVLGNVASATSVTEVGFEYHYRKVADAAERYQAASRKYCEQIDEAKRSANTAFDRLDEALAALESPRLQLHPPGRSGCIAIAIDVSAHRVPQQFASSLLQASDQLSPRLAISAAALAIDEAQGKNTVLGAFLDKVAADAPDGLAGQGLGVFDKVLEVWGWALLCYSEGVDSLVTGLSDFLNSIPLVRSTPLAAWAEATLREVIECLGLQGAELGTPKPVVVNSLHVARASHSEIGDGLLRIKESYSALPGSGSGSALSSTLDGLLALGEQQGGELLESQFTVFTIRFGDAPGLSEIPVTLSLPESLVERGKTELSQLRTSLRSIVTGGTHQRVWE